MPKKILSFFSFKGRLNRKQFFIRLVILYAIFQATAIASFAALQSSGDTPTGASILLGLDTVLNLVLSIAMLSILVRRFHDMGRTGWFVVPMVPVTPVLFAPFTLVMVAFMVAFMFTGAWLPLITVSVVSLYTFVVGLMLIFFPGSKGSNKYGPDLLEKQVEETR